MRERRLLHPDLVFAFDLCGYISVSGSAALVRAFAGDAFWLDCSAKSSIISSP